MSKHTPGPWSIRPSNAVGFYKHAIGAGVALVADSADAALIAAAPDLAEALQALMRAAESFTTGHGINALTPAASRAIARADAALAKAGVL